MELQSALKIQRAWRSYFTNNKCQICELHIHMQEIDMCISCYDKDNLFRLCNCRHLSCPGDCGTLWCGCIDVCRGRCGFHDNVGFGCY